jgi:Antibiotic biosynthesis monooxygenase.
MYLQVVDNEVKSNKKREYMQEAIKFSNDLREVSGCIESHVFSDDDSNVVTILSNWNSEDDMNSDESNQVFLSHKNELKPFFIKNKTSIFKKMDLK